MRFPASLLLVTGLCLTGGQALARPTCPVPTPDCSGTANLPAGTATTDLTAAPASPNPADAGQR